MADDRISAPWTDAQVEALNYYQVSGAFHPFTCYVHSDVPLLATTAGWVCISPTCDYTQGWAHASMADRAAVERQVAWLNDMGFRVR